MITRREFAQRMAAGALGAGAMADSPLQRLLSSGQPAPPRLIFDAMAEVRTIYTMPLIEQILAAGTNAITITLTDPKPIGHESFHLLLEDLAHYDRYFDDHPDHFIKARRVADVQRARREKKLAIFYLIQNAAPIEDDLARLTMLYNLGLRSVQLTYNVRNLVGDGCYERTDAGLSLFGLELIDTMNATGMLVDLSHAGMKTMSEAIAASKKPVIISHTTCRALNPHRRNTTDENLRALAEKGGVAGMGQIRTFMTDKKRDNLSVYFDHIDHAVKVAGVEHVAIGSDRDHRVIPDSEEEIAILLKEEGAQFKPADWPLYLEKLNGPRRMEVVRDGLLERGYAEFDLDKILGGNLLRLYTESVG
ncbi:MAG: membrane dipeptidase [Gemmatimonadaceae bacterium]